jgi:hypothetical protein
MEQGRSVLASVPVQAGRYPSIPARYHLWMLPWFSLTNIDIAVQKYVHAMYVCLIGGTPGLAADRGGYCVDEVIWGEGLFEL